jgi:hypothetical protein
MGAPLKLISLLIADHLGIPGWRGYRFEILEDTDLVQVEGCIPAGVYTRGPRKGQPRYRHPDSVGTRCTVTWTRAEIEARATAWEATTGQCRECVGTGKVYWRCLDAMIEYRTCPRCKGGGKYPSEHGELTNGKGDD